MSNADWIVCCAQHSNLLFLSHTGGASQDAGRVVCHGRTSSVRAPSICWTGKILGQPSTTYVAFWNLRSTGCPGRPTALWSVYESVWLGDLPAVGVHRPAEFLPNHEVL